MNDSIDIISEYLINLMILMCPSKHTGQFRKSFWIIKNYNYSYFVLWNTVSHLILQKKVELFNSLFIKYCTSINNANILSLDLPLKTDKFFSSATFAGVDILKLI